MDEAAPEPTAEFKPVEPATPPQTWEEINLVQEYVDKNGELVGTEEINAGTAITNMDERIDALEAVLTCMRKGG